MAGVVNENEANSLFDALPEWMQVALKEKPKSFKVCLGKALEKRVDACFGEENFRLEKTKTAHRKTTIWRVNRSLAGVGRGLSHLRAAKNLDVNSEVDKSENEYGDAGMNPCQPLPKCHPTESQKKPNGSTGGRTDSDEQEDVPKTGLFAQNVDTTPANPDEVAKTPHDGEREVFTL